MSSNPEPPSSAAHRALAEDEPSKSPRQGLLSRLFGGTAQPIAPSEEPDDQHDPEAESSTGPKPLGLSNLSQMRVQDVSIPRAEIVSVAADSSLEELVYVFRDSGLTRLPVYDGTLDKPVGLVHLKDISLKHGFHGKSGSFEMTECLRPLLYVPPSMTIGVLLTKMQTERTHMALVIDEYGGVDGLVTIENLIEQVIGEIEDEHDVEEAQPWLREADGAFLALAKAPLHEFEKEIGIELVDPDVEEDLDTLGGLVFLLSGHVPVRGEVVAHPSGVEFEVIDADPRRIKRLRVRLPRTEAAE